MNYRIILIIFFSTFQLNSFATLQSEKIKCLSKNIKKNILFENDSISDSQTLKISNNPSIISGTVYAGTNPLPEGHIYLLNYSKSKSTFYTIKNNSIINGDFQFKDVNSGQYTLYIIPELNYDFLYFPKYIPTYFGKTYSWQEASSNNINRDNLNLNLNLLSYPNPFYGEKKISGHLRFDGMYRGITDLPIPVILLNEAGIPMDFRIVDKNSGKFKFENLPEGVYYIHPEIPGLKTTNFCVHIKNNQSNEYNNVNFLVDEENIKIDKQPDDIIPVISINFLKVFLKDDINYPVVCELIDLSGKTISKEVFYSDEILMSTSGMAANLYILKVKTYDNSPVKTTKVFIRNY